MEGVGLPLFAASCGFFLTQLQARNGKSNARDNERSCEWEEKEMVIWMDGVFDLMHCGHMNAFRQARALGTKLIVGVNSYESVAASKGKPLYSEEERMRGVAGCKWVDEVVGNVPYVMDEDYLDFIFSCFAVDFIVHGDDDCLVNGVDVYASAKAMGKATYTTLFLSVYSGEIFILVIIRKVPKYTSH